MPSVNLTTVATAAARWLGILDSGEGLSNQQLLDAEAAANNMFDNWSSEGVFIYQDTLTAAIPLVTGTQKYSIGAAQTINVARPVKIQAASFTNTSGVGGEIEIVDEKKWAAIPDRQSQSNIIRYLFYDRGFPTGFVYLSPVPLSNNPALEIHTWAPLTQFTDLTTAISIIPGYLRMIELGLAIEIAPQYEMAPSQTLMALYQDAVERVRRLNAGLLGDIPPEVAMQAAEASK